MSTTAEPGANIAPVQGHASRWWMLAVFAIAISGCYYEYDVIAPVAEFLRTQRGFSHSQIGMLNAVFSLPNIVLALVGGILIDRHGPPRVALWSAALCLIGAVLTAAGSPYSIMVVGRLIFGVAEEALFIALLAGIAQWFVGGGTALAMALFFSMARVGSYAADTSPTWARGVYESGWQMPLWLGAGITAVSLLAAAVYWRVDRRRSSSLAVAAAPVHKPFHWRDLQSFDRSFWYILWLNVLFASVFFPFRSTFAIIYFQDTRGLSLAEAGNVNSFVFFAAIFATPVFGAIADRFGHRALMLTIGTLLLPTSFLLLGATHMSVWVSTVLMGISFSMVPAVIWPATAMLVDPKRLGTAFGLINLLQNLGLTICNLAAGAINDVARAGKANPAGYDAMLWFFGLLGLLALSAVVLLWRRETGPDSHGLETIRQGA